MESTKVTWIEALLTLSWRVPSSNSFSSMPCRRDIKCSWKEITDTTIRIRPEGMGTQQYASTKMKQRI